MPISKPIIVSDPATERHLVTVQPFKSYPAAPGELYRDVDVNGNISEVYVPDPEREGQIYFYSLKTNGNRENQMYVAVDMDSGFGLPIDGGNFTTGVTSATSNAVYDGGNFTSGVSGVNVGTLNGGVYPYTASLEWKIAANPEVVNTFTGLPPDPIYD